MNGKIKLVALTVAMTVPLAVPAGAAKLNKKSMKLTAGKTANVSIKGAKGAVTWTVKGKAVKIASKTKDGKGVTVKGVKKGTATVVAKNGKKAYKCKVTVKNPNPSLSKTNVKIEEGKSTVVGIDWPAGKAKVKMSAEQKKLVTVKTSRKAVKITGKKAGKTSFYVYSGKKKMKLTVEVVKKGQVPAKPQPQAPQPQTRAPQTETSNQVVKPQPQTQAQTQTSAPQTQAQTTAPEVQGQTYSISLKGYETIAGGETVDVGICRGFRDKTTKVDKQAHFVFENDCVALESIIAADAGVAGVVVGRKQGTCKVYTVSGDGKTVYNVTTVTVTNTDDRYYKYMSWKKSVEDAQWKSGMSVEDKLRAVSDYVCLNFPYQGIDSSKYNFADGKGADCWGYTDVIIDFAKDLGLKGEAYHPPHAWSNLHYVAKIWLTSSKWVYIDASAKGSPACIFSIYDN